LRTKDKADALRLIHVKNKAAHQPAMNRHLVELSRAEKYHAKAVSLGLPQRPNTMP
jgi:hypothetical protein